MLRNSLLQEPENVIVTYIHVPWTPLHIYMSFGIQRVNDLPDDSIYNSAIYVDDTTLYCKSDQAPYLWQQQ